MRQLTETEVQCLMWLVRWAIRRYRGHRQWEDLLTAAYARPWRAAAAAGARGLPAAEIAKRITKAAGWAATDWFGSPENEGRREYRVNLSRGANRGKTRVVALPEVVHLRTWEWERIRDEQGEDGNGADPW